MERGAWEHLRGEINRRRAKRQDRPLARCRLCGGSVYIKAQATADGHVPLFAHHADATSTCPWYQGGNLIPDNARAAQYRGHQECALHRWMCDTIAGFLERDPRAIKVTVDRYLKPAIEERGRYPDIYAELDGLGKFAIEVQLSKPFAFEIAARHRHYHYEAEGVSLIWVFRNLDAELSQGFRDVIAMQRGNAFLFDDAAFTASVEAGELMLSAWLETDRGGWLKPRLISLTDLDRSSARAVFLEDGRTQRLLDQCQQAREKWWQALKVGRPFEFGDAIVELQFRPAWDSIKALVPGLIEWKNILWRERQMRGCPHFLEVAAILFSIARSASTGKERVYVTRYKGDGSLVAMLNARLSGASFMTYADLIEAMLAGTAAHPNLARPSLQAALAKARDSATQVAPGHPVWDAAVRLFPEVLDGMMRAELADLRQLPAWATIDAPAREAA